MKHLILILFAASLAFAQKAEELFQQALMKERSQGDLKGAIEIYQRLAKDKDRKLAARALLEMARCQEKQGGELARQTYARLVKEFSDQSEAVAAARSRMSALTVMAAGTGPRVRQVWAGPDVDDEGSISPDGRYLTYAHWETGDLGVRDLATNTTKLLTNTGGWTKSGGEFAQDSRYSPDGKRLAYNWFLPASGGNQGGYEVRVMNADGSGVRTLGWKGGNGYPVPACWSPDGKTVLVMDYRTDGKAALFAVDAASGQSAELMAPGSFGFGSRASYSPDGKWIAGIGGRDRDIFIMPASGGTPGEIAPHPAHEESPFWTADGKNVIFLSNRSGSFGLWSVPVSDGREAGPAKLIRGDFGQSVRAVGLAPNGSFIYTTVVDGSDIYSATIDPSTGRGTGTPVLVSDRRPGGNGMPSLSADGKRIAFIRTVPRGNEWTLTIRELSLAREKSFSVRVGAMAQWHPDNRRLLVVERDSQPDTFSLTWIDANSGERTLLENVGPSRHPIWPQFSSDGKTLYYLFRQWPGPEFSIMAMDVETRQKRILTKLTGQMRGLALSPDGKWLAAIRHGSEGEVEYFVAPSGGGDVRLLAKDKSASNFFNRPAFTHDSRAILATRGRGPQSRVQTEIILIDLDSGAIRPTGIDMLGIGFLNADPSGTKLYFKAGAMQSEIWIAENIIP